MSHMRFVSQLIVLCISKNRFGKNYLNRKPLFCWILCITISSWDQT